MRLISGPQSSSLHARSCLERRKSFAEQTKRPIVDRPLDQRPATGRTGLTRILHDRIHDDRKRLIQIRVSENDLWRFAAQFEDRGYVIGGRGLGYGGADQRRSGKREMIDPG